VGPRAGKDGAENIALTGIRFRSVQPVASRNIDYASPAHMIITTTITVQNGFVLNGGSGKP